MRASVHVDPGRSRGIDICPTCIDISRRRYWRRDSGSIGDSSDQGFLSKRRSNPMGGLRGRRCRRDRRQGRFDGSSQEDTCNDDVRSLQTNVGLCWTLQLVQDDGHGPCTWQVRPGRATGIPVQRWTWHGRRLVGTSFHGAVGNHAADVQGPPHLRLHRPIHHPCLHDQITWTTHVTAGTIPAPGC